MFHLYVSFPDRKGAVGLDICEAIQNFNKRYGFTNFVLKPRISSDCPKGEKLRRWDKDFIKDFLKDSHVKMVDLEQPEATQPKTPSKVFNLTDVNVTNINLSQSELDIERPIPTTEWLRRVWVCGPPMMNETFDRSFDDFLAPDDRHP